MDKNVVRIPQNSHGEKQSDDEPCILGICREGDMLNMNQIDQIKELQREGYGPSEIAERVGVDRKTVSKYMNIDDYSPTFENSKVKKSKLDAWKSVINE